MCKCIPGLELDAFNLFTKNNPGSIPISSFFENRLLTDQKHFPLYAPLIIEVKHGKRIRKAYMNIHFAYCPFCGEKIEVPKKEGEDCKPALEKTAVTPK